MRETKMQNPDAQTHADLLDRLGKNPRAVVFVDIETGGLDVDKHEILEVCFVREWLDGRDPGIDIWSTRIRVDPDRVDPVAARINGYDPDDWANAPTFAEVAPQIARFLRYGPIVGHNVSFDLAFLRRALTMSGYPSPRIGWPGIDTMSIMYATFPGRYSLHEARERLGIPHTGAHTAEADTLACRRLFWYLLRLNTP